VVDREKQRETNRRLRERLKEAAAIAENAKKINERLREHKTVNDQITEFFRG